MNVEALQKTRDYMAKNCVWAPIGRDPVPMTVAERNAFPPTKYFNMSLFVGMTNKRQPCGCIAAYLVVANDMPDMAEMDILGIKTELGNSQAERDYFCMVYGQFSVKTLPDISLEEAISYLDTLIAKYST